MAKDKNSTSDHPNPSGRPQEHEVVFYNPDGSIDRQTPSAVHTAGDTPDMNPALLKRLDSQAAGAADEHVEELADALYSKFMTLLTDTMEEKGGSLTMDDVAGMGEAFRSQLDDIKDIFLNAVESYTHAREQTRVESERGKVFHRILVHQFEKRFVSEKSLADQPDHLSRRMLPGFYSALSMMFGPPKLERYERQASLVVDRLKKDATGPLEWKDIHRTPEAHRLLLRTQIDIARHFADTEKRLDWLIAMVNSNMIPLEDGRASSGWSFTRESAEGLLRDLFRDLNAALKSPSARQRFADELGGETVQTLDAVMRRFG